jgi:predicted O-methyltransferase YrrM
MADLYHPELRSYLDGLVPPRPLELQKMEKHAMDHAFPIIGPASGYFCYQIARMIGATRVFELGSGFGYSTAYFCQAVKENGWGEVHHTVWDSELSERAKRHLGVLGYAAMVKFHVQEAVEALTKTDGPFDVIFCDIDKTGYPAALPVIYEKLRVGGVMITDNILWSGRMFAKQDDRASETQAILELTHMVTKDPRWIASVVPLRDGLLVATKIA